MKLKKNIVTGISVIIVGSIGLFLIYRQNKENGKNANSIERMKKLRLY
jgi:hypothetical protein